MSSYKSARAVEMAVKEAAKASPLDTNRAIAIFYFHRLLCRVFAHSDSPFVLKGGLGMLARTVDARMTRDVDLATDSLGIDEAVDELVRLSKRDLGDYVRFELRDVSAIKVEDDYRDGYTVSFDTYLGTRMVQRVSVDLVADQIAIGEPELITPVDRIAVGDLPVYDYPVYPAEKSVVDKVCGIVERHNGRPSSRVKDLVDIVIYALTTDLKMSALEDVLGKELALRGIELGQSFSLPSDWGASHARQYEKLATGVRLPAELRDMGGGLALAKQVLDPVLAASHASARWDHASLQWEYLEDGLDEIRCNTHEG